MTNMLELFALFWVILTNLVTFAVLAVASVYTWERYQRGKAKL